MESSFVYNKPVTGKYNIGRRQDATILSNFIDQGECICIYEPPKSGKRSLVQQTFFNMRVASRKFVPVQISLLNVRTIADVMMRLGGEVIKNLSRSPESFPNAVESFLSGTHFVFDQQFYAETDHIISMNWDVDDNDIRSMLLLPYRLAAENNLQLFVIIDEFQNVNATENGDKNDREQI